jgi:hypothetical protein
VTCVRWWFSLDTPVSSTNKTDRHNITVILLKVALTTITLNPEYNDWIIRVIKHTGIITNHIISVKLPYKYKYTKIAPYPIVLVFLDFLQSPRRIENWFIMFGSEYSTTLSSI